MRDNGVENKKATAATISDIINKDFVIDLAEAMRNYICT